MNLFFHGERTDLEVFVQNDWETLIGARDFTLLTEKGQVIGSVNRNFAGFGREIFTDTGVYVLRMDAASVAAEPAHLISRTAQSGTYRSDLPLVERVAHDGRGMTLDERAIMLATAVGVDFDYFSRHSGHSSWGWLPFELDHAGASGELDGARKDSSPADSGSGTNPGVPASGVAAGASMSDAGGSGPVQRVDGQDVWTGDPWGAQDSPASGSARGVDGGDVWTGDPWAERNSPASNQTWDSPPSSGGDGGGGGWFPDL